MGINVGQVTGQEIGTFRGLENVRILQVQLQGSNPDTVLFFGEPGEDNAPVNGDLVIIRDMGGFRMTLGMKDPLLPSSAAGEKKFYSRDSDGVIKAIFHLKSDGSADMTVPGDLNVDGNLNVDGDITCTGDIDADGDISAKGDVVADSAVTAISLLQHFHLGNLGFNTGIPVVGAGVAPPGSPPSISGNEIVDGNGTKSTSHIHSQGDDSNGDTEVDTGNAQ